MKNKQDILNEFRERFYPHFAEGIDEYYKQEDWLLTTLTEFEREIRKEEGKRIRKEFGEVYLPPINEKSFASPIIEVKAVIRQTTVFLKDELDKIISQLEK